MFCASRDSNGVGPGENYLEVLFLPGEGCDFLYLLHVMNCVVYNP